MYDKERKTLLQYPLGRQETNPTFAAQVKIIQTYAFENAQYIETLNITETIETIETMAFESISKLHIITIGKSVSSIKAHAFRYCNSLKTFIIKEKTVGGYHVIDDVLFKETELIHYSSKKETPIVHPYALQE